MTGRSSFYRPIRGYLAVFVLLIPLSSHAWNGAGHRLVAAIAWDHLSSGTREEIIQLLRQHPDYARWIRRASEENQDRTAFIEASTWPDDIRKDKRFHSSGKELPTPTLPGFSDMERRLDWHYVNIPLGATTDKSALSGQLGRQLVELPKILATSQVSAQRVYALPWLIHLVGDAHQPLHTSARVDTDGKWDKLGNGLEVHNPFNSRKPVTTLHAFWDDLPGPTWLRGTKLDAASEALTAIHPRPAPSIRSDRWIEESWQLARDSAYPPGNESVPVITEAFHENSREIALLRVTQAGYRLADLLNHWLRVERTAGQR